MHISASNGVCRVAAWEYGRQPRICGVSLDVVAKAAYTRCASSCTALSGSQQQQGTAARCRTLAAQTLEDDSAHASSTSIDSTAALPNACTNSRRALLCCTALAPILYTESLVPQAHAQASPSSAVSRATSDTSASSSTAATSSVPSAPKPAPKTPPALGELYRDADFQLLPPAGWTEIDTNPQRGPDARGPTPERSPIRARFDSPDGRATISVVVRNAQVLKALLTQVTDVSQYGTIADVSTLVMPRGSTLLSSSATQVKLPARKTTLGDLEPPPQNYYRYEFITPTDIHVVMTVAAQRGRVYVCGGSAAVGLPWSAAQDVLRASAETFRMANTVVRI